MYYASNSAHSTIIISSPFVSTAFFTPLELALEDWDKAVKEIKSYRKELYRTMRAEECESRMRPREIPEAQFKKPTFVRRACGGRWRVMRA